MTTNPNLRTLVFDAESDMTQVKDYALILYDYLSDADPIGADRQGALCLVCGELLAIGNRLKERHEAMFAAINDGRP